MAIMAFFRRESRRNNPTSASRSSGTGGRAGPALVWSIDLATAVFSYTAATLNGRELVPELIRARLADGLRDLELEPPQPRELDRLTAGFDQEAWARLAIAAAALEMENLRQVLRRHADRSGCLPMVEAGFLGVARDLNLLTRPVLCQSEMRVEELARQFSHRLGVAVEGETAAESAEKLLRLDYARLLDEAARARDSAEEQMEYLRKLQEDEMRRRRPRGKW
jgi:hypothetical protein